MPMLINDRSVIGSNLLTMAFINECQNIVSMTDEI